MKSLSKTFVLLLFLFNVHSVDRVFEENSSKAKFDSIDEIDPSHQSSKGYFEGEGVLRYQNESLESVVNFQFKFHKATQGVKNKLIVITPNILGETVLERAMAQFLQENGYHVLVPMTEVRLDIVDENSFQRIEDINRSSLKLTNLLIDYVNGYFNFDRDNIGLVGVSLGGIRSSMLLGSDDRFKAMFIAVAGSDMPSIYAYSEHSIIIDIRERHMEFLGLKTQKEYEDILRENVHLDSSIVANSKYLNNVAMIIANKDTSVPTINQWKLWSEIYQTGNEPKLYTFYMGHRPAAIQIYRLRDDVLAWMDERL